MTPFQMESLTTWHLKGLRETIPFLEAIGSTAKRRPYRTDVLKLAKLCRDLIAASTTRLFVLQLRQVILCLKTVLSQMHISGEKWHLIRGLLAECFLRQLPDTELVQQLLKLISVHFSLFYSEDLIRRELCFSKIELDKTIIERRNRRGLKSSCFISYILHHAIEGRVAIKGKRFISLTNLNGIINCNWAAENKSDVVRVLLQHGSRLSDRDRYFFYDVPGIIVKTLYAIIKFGANYGHWDRKTLAFHVNPSEIAYEVKNTCACFRYLLRDTKNPHKMTFFLADMNYWFDEVKIPKLEKLVLFYDKLFPNCLYGRNIPPSLCHMSRCVIRKILYDNWKLPRGIESLPIPHVLKDYLNLLYD